jgi:hypothetical protein
MWAALSFLCVISKGYETMSRPCRVEPDAVHPKMWRLVWPDGVLSADMYSRVRAEDILRRYDMYVEGMARSARMQGHAVGGRASPQRSTLVSNSVQAATSIRKIAVRAL